MKENILVVIPARSKSKSVKNKNIKLIKKKPLIYYSIKYALKSKIVTKTIVSTDSEKYAKISEKYGAEVPFIRPKKLSGDNIQDYDVISHALKKCEIYYRRKFLFVVLLRPTSPFREKNLIEKSIRLLKNNTKSTSVRSVIKTNCHPWRHWVKKNKFIYSIVDDFYEPYNIPRQKLPVYYFQTGEIEVIKRKTILNGSVSGNNILPLINKEYSIDVDTDRDIQKLNK